MFTTINLTTKFVTAEMEFKIREKKKNKIAYLFRIKHKHAEFT